METTNIRYIVNDVDEAISFYKEFLDFEVDMHPAPGFAALKRGNLELFLNQPGAGGAGQAMPDGQSPKPGGWNRIQIPTDDLGVLYSRLNKKGAKFRNEIVTGQGGKQVLLQDPSGNLIELFEPKQEKSVNPIPEGFHTVTPFLLADDASKLIEFIEKAFDGKVTSMMKSDDGVVRHSTIKIGDSIIMISNGTELYKAMPCVLHLYVKDVDAVYQKAIEAGGLSLREPRYEFYGDRSCGIQDAWDNQWWIATHIEDVNDEEMKKREENFRRKEGLK
jgi:uncharacterized glyoxalase superfamily protein PhnB/catechol 2,3-dioxygenase-like lactoylglutathione lyase family enzyme